MKILLIATRYPYGRQSGRKCVLRTIINSCRSLGHDVRVVVISREDPPDNRDSEAIEIIAPPRLARVITSVVFKASRGLLCLNECLYVSPRTQDHINKLCVNWQPDVVIADMIRTASLALKTGCPTHVDLDDLLSTRYQDLASNGSDSANILGYYGTSLPSSIRKVIARVALLLVGVEARLVAKRESEVGGQAHGISLVAQQEAAQFEQQIDRHVAWLPMSVDIPSKGASVAANSDDVIVFVGGLDYYANLEAIRFYTREVYPALKALGGTPPLLRVIGYCPDVVREELDAVRGVILLGYVEDLAAELVKARAFVAPIPPGTGLKTKVLEAMAAGLPIVSTSHGVQGFPARNGEHYLIANSGQEIAEAITRLRQDPALAAHIGEAGRKLVTELFAPQVVAERWSQALDPLLHMPPVA